MFVWKALFHFCDKPDRLGPKPCVVVVRKDIDVVEVQVKGDVVAARRRGPIVAGAACVADVRSAIVAIAIA